MGTAASRIALPMPYRTGSLAVGDGHAIAWQEFGTPSGMPAVVLHGGPGSVLAPAAARDDLVPWLAGVFAHGPIALQERVTVAWLAWEQVLAGACMPPPEDLQPAMDRYRIQSHYLAHGCWLGEGALHAAARRL